MPGQQKLPVTQGRKGGNGGTGQGDLFGLLRYSHIFASVVREILEIKLLNEVTSEPLTLSQLHLLKLISLNGKHQVGEVADFLGVSPPAATKNIDKLERLGLVARTPSKGDRRATLLESSRKGRELVQHYEELKEERLAPVLEAFTSEELSQLAYLLEKFSVNLIGAQDGDGLCLRCSAYFDTRCAVRTLRYGCPYQKIIDARTADVSRQEA